MSVRQYPRCANAQRLDTAGRAFIRACRQIYTQNRGSVTPHESFLCELIDQYRRHRAVTPEFAERSVESLREDLDASLAGPLQGICRMLRRQIAKFEAELKAERNGRRRAALRDVINLLGGQLERHRERLAGLPMTIMISVERRPSKTKARQKPGLSTADGFRTLKPVSESSTR